MPWRESCAMDERVGFIADHRTGLWTMTELCEQYEISRKTGYKWLDRYRLEGAGGLADRSHAARVHGRATPQHIVDAIVGLRLERPITRVGSGWATAVALNPSRRPTASAAI
jgi:putative transposase